ncbi:uncharacterized protein LOC132706101 isoform X2 [Cylas formicarius]|uniref:uncharacterized protein LOC132706101 isoform X2 n=1 Tax=Cylas formicarius TaxID=197179 RepID=UPI002958D630|nr:uncharacterized protein LOC132706101 isoform X2 [Cylas formicarius]
MRRNMLRTRRRDNNVKPNRRDFSLKNRLDRKSSRGMLYENEELRLKTININAEIERGQSDIKKLKRENEMLKKEIWCLRDEYDKLDKLLKDKKLDFSSSSTTYSSSSDSESCSSCTEESEEVETSQNLKNVQKTNLKNIRDQFDHLSVVTEETSCENSEGNSGNRRSLPGGQNVWNYDDKDVLKADQSYPTTYDNVGQNRAHTLPNQLQMNFFTPIQSSKSFDENQFNQSRDNTLYPEDFYDTQTTNRNIVMDSISDHATTPPLAISPDTPAYEGGPQHFDNETNFLSRKMVRTNANNFYQNMVLVAPNTVPPPETKSMEKKATDLIVKIDNKNFNGKSLTYSNTTPSTTFSNGGNLEELLHDIESISQDILKLTNLQKGVLSPIPEPDGSNFFPDVQNRDLTYLHNPIMDHLVSDVGSRGHVVDDKVHKSELNVVLMPKAMPLIGFDKYKNIERSFERLNSDHLDDASASQQNLCLIPPPSAETAPETAATLTETAEANPFFFGHFNDNYVNADYFNIRYNPENFTKKDETDQGEGAQNVENDENIDLKTTATKEKGKKSEENQPKSPKLSITKKVSIHFKGKKEKEKMKKAALENEAKNNVKYARQDSKKSSIFDLRFGNDASREKTEAKDQPSHAKQKSADKSKQLHQKTPSMESRKSATEASNFEPKTPTSTDSSDKKTLPNGKTQEAKKENERKSRKSTSVSPDRGKHVHVIPDASYMKKHKKHRRERSGVRQRRASVDHRLRERSFSVCTDRSILDSRLGLASSLGGFIYEDYSDRERTNSGSSCDSNQTHRKLSAISVVPLNGKVPWCGCWGNGCL